MLERAATRGGERALSPQERALPLTPVTSSKQACRKDSFGKQPCGGHASTCEHVRADMCKRKLELDTMQQACPPVGCLPALKRAERGAGAAGMPAPADQAHKHTCTIHAIISDVVQEFMDKHDITINCYHAVRDVEKSCNVADGSYPRDVFAVVNKDSNLFIEHAGELKRYRVHIKYGEEIRDFDHLYSSMGSRKVLSRAVVVIKTDSEGHKRHAVAARGSYEDRDSNTKKVHAQNSWGANSPMMYIDANNYLYHVEFEVEIKNLFVTDGGSNGGRWVRRKPPQLTNRYKAAQKEDKTAQEATARTPNRTNKDD
jgi:hypothetical protein